MNLPTYGKSGSSGTCRDAVRRVTKIDDAFEGLTTGAVSTHFSGVMFSSCHTTTTPSYESQRLADR